MRCKIKFPLIILILFIMSGNVHATFIEDFISQDFSGSLFGQKGVFVTTTEGADAVFTNPAGMAMTGGINIGIIYEGDMNITGHPDQYEKMYYDSLYEEYSYKTNFTFDMFDNFSLFGSYSGWNSPFTIALGLGFHDYLDFTRETTEKKSYTLFSEKVDEEFNITYRGGLNYILLSGAFSYDRKYSGGISFGYPAYSNYKNTSDGKRIFANVTEYYNQEDSYEISSSFIRLGTISELLPGLRAGLTYTINGELELYNGEREINNWNGTETTFTLDDKKIDVPEYVSVSVSYNFNRNFHAAVEYQTRDWKDFIDEDGENIYNDSIQDGHLIKAGIHWKFSPVYLDFGYSVQKGPNYKTDNLEYDGLVNNHLINAGIGIEQSGYSFYLGFDYLTADYKQEILGEEYKRSSNHLKGYFSFGYSLPIPQ